MESDQTINSLPRVEPLSTKEVDRFARPTLVKAKSVNTFNTALWCFLALLTIQALPSLTIWAFAWIFLGVAVLILVQRTSLPYFFVIEAPIFYAIVSYSSSILFLASFEGLYDLEHDAILNDAVWVAWFGMVLFIVGIAVVVLRKPSAKRKPEPVVKGTERQAWMICIFGILCGEFIIRFIPGPLMVIFVVFGFCTPLGLFMLLQIYSESNVRWVGTWKFYVWLAVLCIWSIRSVIGGIFGSTLLILGLYFAQHSRNSKIMLISVLSVGFILAPLLQDTKSEYRQTVKIEEGSQEKHLGSLFVGNFTKVFLNRDMNAYLEGMTALAYRVCTFDIWLRVKMHMDTVQDFAGGKTITDALITSFIPRFLWPDKPLTGGVTDLAIKYADMAIMPGTSVSIGPISEFYINGGLGFLLLGMFILGVLGGLALKWGYYDRVQPLGYMMAISLFSVFVRPETSLSDLLGAYIRLLFLWWILRLWLLHKNRSFAR